MAMMAITTSSSINVKAHSLLSSFLFVGFILAFPIYALLPLHSLIRPPEQHYLPDLYQTSP
jgi:hypothetical protein